jgi:hypothetical protein
MKKKNINILIFQFMCVGLICSIGKELSILSSIQLFNILVIIFNNLKEVFFLG